MFLKVKKVPHLSDDTSGDKSSFKSKDIRDNRWKKRYALGSR